MENPADDPRQFAHDLGEDGLEGGMPGGVDALLCACDLWADALDGTLIIGIHSHLAVYHG